MKTILKTLITLVLLTFAVSASALDVNNNANSESWSGAGAGAKAEAYSNGQNNSGNTHVQGSDLSNAVGTAFAPALTTTLTETCMGSTSVGAGFSGGSFSFGTTWRDHACVRRLDAREIRSYGDIQAAKEIMCDSDLVRDAFKRVGRPCTEDGGSYVAASQAQPAAVALPVEQSAPRTTDSEVHDDQDSNDQKQSDTLRKADEAREAIRTKYAF